MTGWRQRTRRWPGPEAWRAWRSLWMVRLAALWRAFRSGPPQAGAPTGPADLRLEPLFVAQDRRGFVAGWSQALEGAGAATPPSAPARLQRFCLCCNRTTVMRADGANRREGLVCSRCGMNNRQRLVARLAQQALGALPAPSLYLMEQVTPFFRWASRLPGARVHGSEYLGAGRRPGERVLGLRHEDAMNLSFASGSFDLVISNDVLEHVPDPSRVLGECFRVLKPGGTLLATFPFLPGNDQSVVRARLAPGGVEHLLPPEYHGNPVSPGGSLVFRDFGWDLLEEARSIGFAHATCESYASEPYGHPGPGLLVFRLAKAGA